MVYKVSKFQTLALLPTESLMCSGDFGEVLHLQMPVARTLFIDVELVLRLLFTAFFGIFYNLKFKACSVVLSMLAHCFRLFATESM